MKKLTNGPLQGRLYQGYVSDFTQDKKIWCFELKARINGHIKSIALASYFEILSEPTQSFINHRVALHAVKSTAINLNMDILNLDEFDPRCPTCSSYVLTEEVEGEYLCLNCGEAGPITAFFAGGMTAAYINYHSQSNVAGLTPQCIAMRTEEYFDGKGNSDG